MQGFCFGKLPARPNAIKLKFNSFLGGSKPLYPAAFGHEEATPPIQWQMCANNRWGVCVVAGGMHETKLACHVGGKPIPHFTDTDVAEDFTAITGQPPGPETGADMQQAASYRLKTGLRDSTGARHQIGAYVEPQAGNVHELLTACYLFDGMTAIGIELWSSDMDDFIAHRPWGASVKAGSFEGRHYVPVMALRGNLVCVTWARFHPIRIPWFVDRNDESIAYITQENLTKGKSPEGYDYPGLVARQALLQAGQL